MFNITLSRPPLQVSFETGSIAEIIGVLDNEQTTLVKMFQRVDEIAGAASGEAEAPAAATTEAPPKRGRGPNKPKVDAVAPAPLPVPGAAPSPPVAPVQPAPDAYLAGIQNKVAPVNTAEGPNGIPAFLDRTAAAPPPPPPPLLPVAPPSGVLGGKVVAALKALAAKGGDGGASLVTWLAQPSVALVVPNATFDEACAVVMMTTDEKLAPVATALGA